MAAGPSVHVNGPVLGQPTGAPWSDAARRPPRRWPGVLAVVLGVLAAYTLVALIGGWQDAREQRVLGVFTPVFEWLRDNGGAAREWLHKHRYGVGLAGSGLLLATGLAALARTGRRAGPVVLLVVVLGLAGWAQVALQSDATQLGLGLYLAAVAGAVGLGIWCPFKRLASFPPYPPSGVGPTLPFGWECALVLGLTLIGLVSRTWALTELYDFFDLEMIDSMVQARTWSGYAGYLNYGFVQNNGGAIHLLPAELLFRLFGTSIFTLRMTAVLWSISAIPLMYMLGRRIGGVAAGIFASLFLITAPEQLFWARNENVFFSAVAVCALVTAHLALWMVERFSPLAVFLNALWMPWCRWFYSASMVAFLIPITTALHAMVFGRRLWRKVWYVVPLLAVGVGLWISSLTVMRAALHDWEWRFVDPSAVYGASAWRKQGEFANATIPELIGLQAVSMSKNFAEVARNMTYQTENFSHWCQRSQPAEHRTILNVGLTLLVFVGLGYLLGQFPDRRAFLLIVWWAISVLPAILSQEPADRRMAMVFPASHALGGTVLAAFLYIAAERGGRIAERLAGIAAALGVAAIALTNLASHLLLPINPVLFGDYPRFTRPLLEGSDAVFTNLPAPFRTFSIFGNLDHFLAAPTCLQFVEPSHWLRTALDPACAFDDALYGFTIGRAETERVREAYNPKRISYLLNEDPVSAPQIALLRALHPDAELQRHNVARAERTLVAMTVGIDEINALRAPTLRSSDGVTDVLAGVATRPGGADGAAPPAGTTVDGGILIDADGWYRWSLDPPCPAATLAFDGQAVVAGTPQPMLAGVHPFSLSLPAAAGCALPLHIVEESLVPHRVAAVGPESFVSPSVATLAGVRAPAVDTFAGYDAPLVTIQFKSRPIDFGVDAQGRLSVLLKEADGYHIRRYSPAGKEVANWGVEVPQTINPATIAVTADGTTAVLVQNRIQMYDAKGQHLATWMHPWFVWETQLAFWGDLLVTNIHHRDSLAIYSRDGKLVQEFKTFEGGPGKLYAPMAFTLSPDGDLLVEQADGLALRFRLEGPEFKPVFVESFRVDAASPGSGFDGSERILIASEHGLRAFGSGGTRLMAIDPQRDPSQQGYSNSLHVRRIGDQLLVLDTERNALWRIPG